MSHTSPHVPKESAMEIAMSAILNIMYAVYWLCKEDIAMLKLESLSMLLVMYGITMSVNATSKLFYCNHARAREFVMCFSTVIKRREWKKIRDSPVIAVAVDESTDISTSENMVVYITRLALVQPAACWGRPGMPARAGRPGASQ